MEKSGKKKLFVVIGKLGGGGAEHVVVRILRHLDRERFLPVLALFEKEGVLLEDVPADVPILDCGRRREGGTFRWLGRFASFLRKESPDVVLSVLWFSNAVTLLARLVSGVRCRIVVSERMTVVGSDEGIAAECARRMAIRLLYPGADRVVCNSVAMRHHLVDRFRIPETRVDSIPNPVEIEEIRRKSVQSGAGMHLPDHIPVVVGMGRLSREKGFDILIRAAGKSSVPFHLLLLGEGKEMESLVRLVRSLGIDDRVTFAGYRSNPYPFLGLASVFVLPSRYEGFPNSLVEAMALGLPCVAARCPTGPEEIIADGETGLLVPVEDPEAMARAIERLLGDGALREQLGKAAMESVRRYDAARIVRKFESLLEEVAG